MADALDLGSSIARCVGSNPTWPTNASLAQRRVYLVLSERDQGSNPRGCTVDSKRKGGIGVAVAIAHFAVQEDIVYLPISETGCDLVIDRAGVLLRVEVKSSWNGVVDLRSNAGYYSRANVRPGKFDAEKIDLLVIYDAVSGKVYEYPASALHGRSTIRVPRLDV
jgi:hypothetical protein